jgi:Ca2+-binding EF-hand superfamily protein
VAKNENFISQEEFIKILRFHGVTVGPVDVKNLFERFDKDKDGRVCYKDFANEMLTVEQQERVKREEIIPYRQFGRE